MKPLHSEFSYSLEEIPRLFENLSNKNYTQYRETIDSVLVLLEKENWKESGIMLRNERYKKRWKEFCNKYPNESKQVKMIIRRVRTLHPQKTSIRNIPIIQDTPDILKRLTAKGITNTWDLLDCCLNPENRRELANDIGIDVSVINEIVEYADLMRLMYIGPTLAQKYHHAGVTGVEYLSKCNPIELYDRCRLASKEMDKRPPAKSDIEKNIDRAKLLVKHFPYVVY